MRWARPGDIPQFLMKRQRRGRKNTSYSVFGPSIFLGRFKHNWVGQLAFALSHGEINLNNISIGKCLVYKL
jgi:hypothetical protein